MFSTHVLTKFLHEARTDIYRQMFLQLQDALTTLAGEGQEDAMGTTRDRK